MNLFIKCMNFFFPASISAKLLMLLFRCFTAKEIKSQDTLSIHITILLVLHDVWVMLRSGSLLSWIANKDRLTNTQPTHTICKTESDCLFEFRVAAVSVCIPYSLQQEVFLFSALICTDHSYVLLIADCFPFLQSLKREPNYPTSALKDIHSASFLKILQKEVTVTNPSLKDFSILTTFYPQSTCFLSTQCRHFHILKLFINYLSVFKPPGSQSRYASPSEGLMYSADPLSWSV